MFIQPSLSLQVLYLQWQVSPQHVLELHMSSLRNTRVLVIVTSNAQMGPSGKATGIWAEELAVPYYLLHDADAHISIASPAGGAVRLDAGSIKPAGENSAVLERFLADMALQQALRNTVRVDTLNGAEFDALFFPGGHGTMWDLPTDPGVKQAVESALVGGRFVASVCHGAAGLVSAQRADGKAAVEGFRINSFTNAEEAAVGLAQVVPFQLESRLRELGALFEGAANWQAFALRDGPFITGQNPQSSALVAQQLMQALESRKGV
jgi:putative intracellular protease/amidase